MTPHHLPSPSLSAFSLKTNLELNRCEKMSKEKSKSTPSNNYYLHVRSSRERWKKKTINSFPAYFHAEVHECTEFAEPETMHCMYTEIDFFVVLTSITVEHDQLSTGNDDQVENDNTVERFLENTE